VVNMARYYHYKTVCMGSKEDNIYNNVCKGLDIIRGTNYKPEGLIMPLRLARVQISLRKGRSSSRKRSSSYSAPLPPSKCIYLSSLIKRPIIQNCIH
jgi:hypothetical protein